MVHKPEAKIKKPQASKVDFLRQVACAVLVISLLVIFGMSGSELPASADSPTPTPTCYPAGYAHPDGTAEMVCLPAAVEVGPAMVDFSAFEQRVLELVNQQRWNNGNLPPLKGNQHLTNAARYHSEDMRNDGYFEHDSYSWVGGRLVFERSWYDRITSYYNASYIGENIAGGFSTPSSVMAVWMSSSGHRANILNSYYREIGIGYASGGYYGHYWTQDFAMKSNVYPVVINREAYSTTTPSVSLYVYGCDWATQMRFSNDGTNWSAWESCNSHKSWTLAGCSGLRTVYCQITNGSTTYSSNDDIYLEVVPVLSVTPNSLSFLRRMGTSTLIPPTQSISIEGTCSLDWSATADPGIWLSASSGTAPSTLVVSTTRTSPAGTYTGFITISATTEGVENSPQTVQVTLTIADKIHQINLPLIQKEYQ